MSDEPLPSRSYVVKQGGFTDPIVDAVMNLGRSNKDGDTATVTKKKPRKAKPPDSAPVDQTATQNYTPPLLPNRSQHSLNSTNMPGSFPGLAMAPATGPLKTVPNPFTISVPQKAGGMYLAKAPGMPHRGSSRSGGGTGGLNGGINPVADIGVGAGESLPLTTTLTNTSTNATPLSAPVLLLPSMLPKPPPIQMPQMQQPPKFAPIPEPLWEKNNGNSKSEAERFKEMVLLGTSPGANGNQEVNANAGEEAVVGERPRKKKKKRRREVPLENGDPAGEEDRDRVAGSELTARPPGTQQPVPATTNVATTVTIEEDEALLHQQRQETRRRRRRTMRSAIAGNGEDGQGGTASDRVGRRASMRRRNVWDDVPEFANLDSPTIPEADESQENPENNNDQNHDAQQALHEPPPPPFPYPTPSTGRLPPAFGSVVLEGHEGRRSPPPSFEFATRGTASNGPPEQSAVDQQAAPADEDEDEEEIPPSPSTVSTVRRARIRNETPRQRRRREDRERWERAREQGKDLDEMIGRERERIERMQHWGQSQGGTEQAADVESDSVLAGGDGQVDEEDLRFSREQKGKGRAIYYDATDLGLGEPLPGPGLSRASSMSTNLARSVREPFDEEDEVVPVASAIRGNSQEVDLDQNGEGSKPSGFVTQELAMAGVDLDEIVGSPVEEQDGRTETEVPALVVDVGGETVRSHSPSTPKAPTHALSPVSTVTVQAAKEDKDALATSPNMHGSRFLEGISEGPDGQLEVVPGVLDLPVTQEEPESMSTPPAVPEKDVVAAADLTSKSLGVTRKNSLPPLFSKRRSGRKISNPWALFRQTSTSNKKPEAEKSTEPSPSPGTQDEEASSPKETGLSKSPFFRAASHFLKPNLGLEPKKEETEHVPKQPVPEVALAPVVMPSWNRQVSTSTVKTTSTPGQPAVVYKHPFNRAVKPAWMQNAAPIWQDPKAYVMDESRPVESPAEEEPRSPPIASPPLVKVGEEWEMVPEPVKQEEEPAAQVQTVQPRETAVSRKPAPAIPARRPTAPAYPPPLLASAQQPASSSSESSLGESESTEDSDSETSSDGWSVSDAVARPPAAYRLLPPRGIPANVLRAANEPPPLPRRNRENRPKPNGPRQRGAPPPLPPRNRPSASEPIVAPAAAPAPAPLVQDVVAKPSDPVLPRQPAVVEPPKVEVAPVAKVVPAAPLPRRKSAGKTETPNMSQPTTPGLPSSTRPTAGDRTPSAISGYFNKPVNQEGDRPRTRSAGAGLRPLAIANNMEASRQEASPKLSPATQGVPVVFPQSKPLRVGGGVPAPTRPKATHHATSPAERKSKPNARLAIKPRYDDRPEQELKSQLSNRINKWRLAAIRPDPPETWEPEDDEAAEAIDQQAPSNGFARSKSMPNFVQDTEDHVDSTPSPVAERQPVKATPSPPGEAKKPETPPAPVEEPRQRVVSNRTNRSAKAEINNATRPISTPGNIQSAASAETAAVRSPGLEYTDLDLVAAQLQGTDREYEGMNAITSFVGEEIARGASPDSLANLMLAPVEIESRRTTKEGKSKLKLTALGIRVHKCSICLSQFRAGDIMAMMPKCSHLGHQRCVVNWLVKDARCMVCREPL